MKKWIVAIVIAVCICFLGKSCTHEDTTPPKIEFPEEEIVYQEGSGYYELLKGTTAYDEEDGDVTKSIIIESVYPDLERNTCAVVYVAKDKSNNIAKRRRTVWFEQYVPKSEIEIFKEQKHGIIANLEKEKEEALAKAEAEEKARKEAEEKARQEAEAQAKAQAEALEAAGENPEGAEEVVPEEVVSEEPASPNPVITLVDDVIRVAKGEKVNRIFYVKDITDDVDDRYSLFRNIRIYGDELDVNTPGIYHQIYYVVDSEGNQSNEELLTIIVE